MSERIPDDVYGDEDAEARRYVRAATDPELIRFLARPMQMMIESLVAVAVEEGRRLERRSPDAD